MNFAARVSLLVLCFVGWFASVLWAMTHHRKRGAPFDRTRKVALAVMLVSIAGVVLLTVLGHR